MGDLKVLNKIKVK